MKITPTIRKKVHSLQQRKGMVYHLSHNDLDGLSPIALSLEAFPNVEYKAVGNHEVDKEVIVLLEKMQEDDLLILTDISPSAKVAESIEVAVIAKLDVLMFDHHLSAIELNNYDWAEVAVMANQRFACGTSLYADFLMKIGVLSHLSMQSLEQFVENVRSWDTWDWKREGNVEPQRLNNLFYLIGFSAYLELVRHMIKQKRFVFTKEFELLLKIEEKRIYHYLRERNRYAQEIKVDGKHAAVVLCEQYHSEVGHFIAETRDYLDYVVLINLTKGTLSFRSKDDKLPVVDIAKRFGGGGHPHAAGCAITDENIQQYVKPALNTLNLIA
ncbi:DHHA1 domain-containing protein [Psychrobacillus sp. FSL H8-0510]|uniref:DHHA1 domain-containing protein n=1 Tax=Psychrobacillus sp. FSL H8-0510 TaxID=2921394 RepID=UPI0030FB5068